MQHYDDVEFNQPKSDKLLYTSENRQKLTSLYNEFINCSALLINDYCDDVLDIFVFYSQLLYKGIFSLSNTFDYHDLMVDKNNCQSIFGARIVAGFGVCRHIAENLKDIYNQLDYNAIEIICAPNENKCFLGRFSKLYYFLQKIEKQLHLVIGVNSNEGALVVDPTWNAIGTFNNQKNEIITLKKLNDKETNKAFNSIIGTKTIAKYFPEEYEKFLEMAKSTYNLNNTNYQNIIKKYHEISFIVNENIYDFKEWNQKHIDLIREIAELDKLLSCYKDDEFTKKLKQKQ